MHMCLDIKNQVLWSLTIIFHVLKVLPMLLLYQKS